MISNDGNDIALGDITATLRRTARKQDRGSQHNRKEKVAGIGWKVSLRETSAWEGRAIQHNSTVVSSYLGSMVRISAPLVHGWLAGSVNVHRG